MAIGVISLNNAIANQDNNISPGQVRPDFLIAELSAQPLTQRNAN